MSAEVRDDVEGSRFELLVDGEVAGLIDYRRSGDRWVMVHTEIDDAHEGEGLGSELARGALDQVRAAGGSVVPSCPFIRGWIERHDDYQDLVAR